MVISNYELLEGIAETPEDNCFQTRHRKNPKRLFSNPEAMRLSDTDVLHSRRRIDDERQR